MIYNVTGDILLSGSQAIAHGIASNDPMKQGLALALHIKFPSMHKDFHHWCHQQHPKPGSAWMWGGPKGVRIINLITQEGTLEHGSKPGKATLKSVRDSLKLLVKIIENESITSVALPKLATGVGGLEWEKVEPVIEELLGDLDIPVYVYTKYVAGQKASEPGL